MSEFPKSDVLFLLVGANPLPNYVAALLLATDKATIYLLHSEGPKSTIQVACHLKECIKEKRPSVTTVLRGIDEADGQKIESRLIDVLSEINHGQIGLNYTGGTKPMAVHTFHIIRRKFPNACFSYLDARSLKMCINQGDEPTQMQPVGRAVELDLKTLLKMHGYALKEPRRRPEHPELYRALVTVHTTPTGFHEWKGKWNEQKKSKGWLRTHPLTTLPKLDEHPHLGPIVAVFENWGGDPAQVAQHLGQPNLESCRKWFDGTWLEEYALESLASVASDLNVRSFGANLEPKPIPDPHRKTQPGNLELDVAAMVGYQLFAVSCITSSHADSETKSHLFQAFVRARQLGGDEARVGLVCCAAQPDTLKAELEQSWDAEGKIHVFGQRDLSRLSDGLKNWIKTANKEV